MMRLTTIYLAFTVLLLAACAPASATFDRDGDTVTVQVEARQTLHDATVSIVNATTTDERCVQLGDTDLGCTLGTISEGETATIEVTSEGELSCVAFGYAREGQLGSYRPFACKAR